MLRPLFLSPFALPPPLSQRPFWRRPNPSSPRLRSSPKRLKIDALIAVMRTEGLANGKDMEADLFPGQGGAAWRKPWSAASMTPPACTPIFDAALTKRCRMTPPPARPWPISSASPLGQRIVGAGN